MSDWIEVELGEVAPISYGKSLSEPFRRTGNVPVYSSAGVTGSHDQAIVKGPSVIIGRKGNVGTVYFSEVDSFPIDTAFYTQGSEGTDLRFLFYKLLSLNLNNLSRDSAVPGLRRSEYSSLRTTFPKFSEQSAIAEVLGALDDKIAANERLVRSADSLSQLTFSTALTGSAAMPLSTTAEFVNGKAFTKDASGTGRVVVRIAELNSGIGKSTVYSDATVDEKHVARAGDILFAWSGSLTLSRWFRDDAIINQHIFKVIPKAGYPNWLVFELIRAKLAEFKSIAADKATTMGHIQRRHLDEAVAVPSRETVSQIGVKMSALWQRALVAEQESVTLAGLRDTLLPELMSGRLRVKDAEKKIKEVM